MRETQLISRIRKQAGTNTNPLVIKGIGDDCAILRPQPNEDLVFTSDFVLEGRHFTLKTHRAADVGHKALARSLSDLAAMGSQPVFCLVSLAIPATLGEPWLRGFYRGLLALAKKYQVALVGGDLAQYHHVVADVICCGHVSRGQSMLRSAARVGDRIYVTGELGASANGFASGSGKNFRRHVRPEPRVAAALALRRLGVKAAIDLSDGLSLDLRRLCIESNVSADLESDPPVARGASLDQALNGGEDYELLFTAPQRVRVPDKVAGLAITPIGCITAGRAGRVRFHGRLLKPKGFDHFV